jgi:predicted ribosomally synthesized peptide with SipW-like signal peptide
MEKRRTARKLGLTFLLLALLGLLIVVATWAAFSDTTANADDRFDAGSVDIEDNDSGSRALYDVFDGTPFAKPTDSDSGCIKVTYNGSLDSIVHLYGSDDLEDNPLDDQLTLTITSGTGAATNNECTGLFTAAGATGDVYSDSLANFMSTYNDYTNNLTLNAGGDAVWSQNETVTYKFEVTLTDDADVNDANSKSATGYATGSHSFTWEARNN